MVNEGVNGSEEVYEYLVREMGYDSVTAADAAADASHDNNPGI